MNLLNVVKMCTLTVCVVKSRHKKLRMMIFLLDKQIIPIMYQVYQDYRVKEFPNNYKNKQSLI